MDSAFFDKEKYKLKNLYLILEENDSILDSIKTAFREKKISKGTIIKIEGYIKNFTLNYFQRSSLKNIQVIEPKKIIKSTGEFKYDFVDDRLFGRLRLILKKDNKNIDGIFIKGKAVEGLKIIIQFLEVE